MFFFYNPDLKHLELGKLSVLWEIFWTRQLRKLAPAVQYYDMNYYVHQCPRMMYAPTFLARAHLSCTVVFTPTPYSLSATSVHTGHPSYCAPCTACGCHWMRSCTAWTRTSMQHWPM